MLVTSALTPVRRYCSANASHTVSGLVVQLSSRSRLVPLGQKFERPSYVVELFQELDNMGEIDCW
jgi:hypothetical protein